MAQIIVRDDLRPTPGRLHGRATAPVPHVAGNRQSFTLEEVQHAFDLIRRDDELAIDVVSRENFLPTFPIRFQRRIAGEAVVHDHHRVWKHLHAGACSTR